MKGENDSLLLV